jgi:hypothetical protein
VLINDAGAEGNTLIGSWRRLQRVLDTTASGPAALH